VYVHGSGPQPAPQELKRALDSALFGRDQGARTEVAYYADLLHPAPVLEVIRAVVEAVVEAVAPAAQGETQPSVTAGDVDPADTRGRAFVRRVERALSARESASARTSTVDAGPRRLLPSALRALLFRLFVRFFLGDAHAYFFEGKAGPIAARVAATLDAARGPVVVIGHSLGAIVAYDVLASAESSYAVPLLVTAGCPLGIDAVKELVHQPPAVPASVARWLNVSDPLDVAAADPILADDYAPGERINDTIVDNRAWHPHDLAGYLRTPEVRTAVSSLDRITAPK
jgi:hypothetical protein